MRPCLLYTSKDLTLTGAYYYPEHWDESQWERDFKQMHDLGFEFTHFAPPAECLLRTSYMATLTEPLIDEAVEIIGGVLGEKV